MPNVRVRLKKRQDDSYRIHIREGLFQELPSLLSQQPWGEKYAIIADSTIGRIFGKDLVKALMKAKIEAYLFTFPPGDQSKSMPVVEKIMGQMLNKKIDRHSAVITLGGGVAGDLAGFIAAIYMRGIPYVHIPTSLIAMADSAIGGKTGVNMKAGKNLAGRIHQPKAVYMDPELLQGLPERELLSGMGEVVKCAIIKDPRLFRFLEKRPHELAERTPKFLNRIITRSAHIKVDVIQKDEHESGHRQILNYGHTIGHGLEKLSKYELTHGEAISMGMKLVNIMSTKKGYQKATERDRVNNLINNLDILKNCDQTILNKKIVPKLWKIMQTDKKAHKGIIQFVVVPKIGKTLIASNFTQRDLTSAIGRYA